MSESYAWKNVGGFCCVNDWLCLEYGSHNMGNNHRWGVVFATSNDSNGEHWNCVCEAACTPMLSSLYITGLMMVVNKVYFWKEQNQQLARLSVVG